MFLVAAHGVARVLQAFDLHQRGQHRTAGRVNARSKHFAGLHHFRVRENHVAIDGWIARGGDSIGEVRGIGPDLIGENVALRAQVGMDVDHAGDDGFACKIELPRTCGNRETSTRANVRDAAIFDQHIAAFDHLIALHRDQPRVAEREYSRGAIAWNGKREVGYSGLQIRGFRRFQRRFPIELVKMIRE